VLFEMTAGSPPFHRGTPADTMSAILNEPPPTLKDSSDRLPRRLPELVLKLLAKEPSSRPASARILLEELRAIQEEATAQAAATSVDSLKPMSIAVLPLENISGEPGQEFIADGMTDALIHDLARIEGFRVISRTSVMAYKGRYASIGELARELGVDFLVEGSVLHAGDRVRISAQLIRAATDEHLWADRFDRDLRDVLGLQSEVAQAIAEAVNITLSPSERVELAATRQVDPDAYLLELKGQKQLSLRKEASFLKAMRCFEQSIEIDPTYAPANVGLADTYNMLMTYGLMPVAEALPASRAAVEKAMKLDSTLPGAQRALALCKWQAEFDWIGAEETYRQAIERDPTAALTVQWYGVFLAVTGRMDSGLQWLSRALELDPLSLNFRCFYGWVLYFSRRFEEAIPHFRRILRIDPDHMLANWFMGESLTEIGEHDEAIAMNRHACELGEETSRLLAYFGYSLGRAGRRDEALEVMAKLQKRAQTDYMPPYFYALIHCGLGQTNEALNWLQKAADLPDSMIRDLMIDVPLECLRTDSRYQDLLKQINLAGISERPVDPPV
jgi:TolB-like protein/Tfp pilus assembly protein PilF